MFAFLVIAYLVYLAAAQTVHQVVLGVEGSFFEPGTVSAAQDDIVMFIFSGDVHGVVQSTFEHPCDPLPGGFSSGLDGTGSDFSGPIPVWNLTVSNVSGPIWYFCPATRPMPHCAAGMVGAINPPSQPMYEQFVAAAKASVVSASALPSVVLSGQGAFATTTPIPESSLSISVTSLSSTTSTSTSGSSASASSSVPSASSTSAAKTSDRTGAIAGGAAAAAVVLVLCLFLIFYTIRRRRTRRQQAVAQPFTNTPNSPPHTGMSETFSVLKAPNTPTGVVYGPRHQTSNGSMTMNSVPYNFPPELYSETSTSVPVGPNYGQLRSQPSTERLAPLRHPETAAQDVQEKPSNLNKLASEVAGILLQQGYRPGTADSKTVAIHQDSINNNTDSRSPPQYRSR